MPLLFSLYIYKWFKKSGFLATNFFDCTLLF
jgi:hypothetical protein